MATGWCDTTPFQSYSHLPPVYACELCQRTSSSKPVFGQDCLATISRSRAAAYRRLEAGLHPHPRRGGDRVYQAGSWIRIQTQRVAPQDAKQAADLAQPALETTG